MKIIRTILIYISVIFFLYVVFYFGFNPYNKFLYISLNLSHKLQIYIIPFTISIFSLIMFLIDKLKTKKYNWFYFLIISINLTSHVIALFFYKN